MVLYPRGKGGLGRDCNSPAMSFPSSAICHSPTGCRSASLGATIGRTTFPIIAEADHGTCRSLISTPGYVLLGLYAQRLVGRRLGYETSHHCVRRASGRRRIQD